MIIKKVIYKVHQQIKLTSVKRSNIINGFSGDQAIKIFNMKTDLSVRSKEISPKTIELYG